jgi:protein phosphatase
MTHNGYVHASIHGDRLRAWGISHPGRWRTENQDSILLDERGCLALLADGMGGHERGGEASRVAVEIVRQQLTPEALAFEMQNATDGFGQPLDVACMLSLVDKAVQSANDELYRRNLREGLQRFMGTTLVGLAVLGGGVAVWFHVGDSRIYRWRDDRLDALTTDHSVRADWERNGKIGAQPPKNIITRAIGPSPFVDADKDWSPVRSRDMFLLCSDGLSDMVGEQEIGLLFQRGNDPQSIVQDLVDAANAAGGKDNISAVVCAI